MKILNHMDVGMHPLNYASKLAKTATDVIFGLAINDEQSTLARLLEMERQIAELRQSIKDAPEV